MTPSHSVADAAGSRDLRSVKDGRGDADVQMPVWGEQHLRAATRAAGVALWAWNVDTDAMDEAAYDLWGVPKQGERLSFAMLSQNIHPADLERVSSAFSATRAVLGSYEIDFRVQVGGDIRWISARGQGALLGDLLSVLLEPYDEREASVRIRVSVPKMRVGEASSTSLAMVIHELATNAAKYGALSSISGTLDVSCNADDEDIIVITWAERGGPPVVPPASEGFGSKLVDRSISAQLGGSIAFDWAEAGLVATLRMSKMRLAN